MSSRSRAAKAAPFAAAKAPAAAVASKKPSRAAAAKKSVIEVSSDDSDDDEEQQERKYAEAESESESEEEEKEAYVPKSKKTTAAAAAAASAEPAAAVKKPRAAAKKASAAVAPLPAPASGPVSPAQALHMQLGAIMTEAQTSYTAHASLAVQAQALLAKDPATFSASFLAHAAFVCAKAGRKLPAVQRVIQWMGALIAAAFSSTRAEAVPFAEEVLQQLLLWSGAKDKTVRARSITLFGEAISRLTEDAEVADFLFERATETLLERCSDKQDAVRVAALISMHRLQEEGPECPVKAEYVRLMKYDLCKEVRKAAIDHVAAGSMPEAIRAVIARTQDVESSVRTAAYKCIQDKVHIKQTSIAERIKLIRTGFHDRVPEVSKAARALVESWLELKQNDVMRLLKSLDVSMHTEECALVLAHCFTSPSILAHKKDTTKQPPFAAESLTPEQALYWRVLAETLKTECNALRAKGLSTVDADAALDAALPDTVELCALLKQYMQDEFISSQLLQLCLHGVDVSDEAGRRELGALVESMLRSIDTPQVNVPVMMRVYRLVHEEHSGSASGPNQSLESENSFIRVILELLAEIRDPIAGASQDSGASQEGAPDERQREELEAAYAQLQADIQRMQVQKQACINAENYAGAEQIKSAMIQTQAELAHVEHELNNTGFKDDATWARMLFITGELLENHTRRTSLNHAGLSGLLDTTIRPGIHSEHPMVQTLSMKALALYALLDYQTARSSFNLFLAAAQTAEDSLQQATALRAVTDLMMMFEDLLEPEPAATAAAAPADAAEGEEAKDGAESAPIAPVVPAIDEAHSLRAQVQSLFQSHLMIAFEQPEDEAVREVSVMALECLAKLWLFDRLPVGEGLLAAVMYIFFHPKTDTRIVQCLAVFVPAFLMVNSAEHVPVYFHAILPTMRVLHQGASQPTGEEERNIWQGFSAFAGLKAMLSFLAHVPASMRMESGYDVQQSLGLEFAHQLLAFPAAPFALQIVQAFSCLTLTGAPIAPLSGAAAPAPYLPSLLHLLTQVSSSLRDKVALKELTKFVEKLSKSAGEHPELSGEQIDAVELAATARVEALTAEQEAEAAQNDANTAAAAAAAETAAAEEAAASKSKKRAPKAAATKAAPAKGKRALKPKTPAKGKKAAAAKDSESEEESAASASEAESDSEEDGGFKISKSKATKAPAAVAAASKAQPKKAPLSLSASTTNQLPSSSAAALRPSRGAKVQAQASMAKAAQSQSQVDKILDAESGSEESEDDEEEEEAEAEQENVRA